MQSSRFNPAEMRVPKTIHAILGAAVFHYANDQQDQAIAKIMEITTLNSNYRLQRIGKHGNNLIFKLLGFAEEPLIIQLITKSVAAEDAYRILKEANPSWMARTADSVTYFRKNEDLFYTASIIEYCCANLSEFVETLEKEKDFSKRIHAAVQITSGLSDILRFLTANKLIWTDLKPANILLRHNQDQVIADFKTIFNPELMPKKDEILGTDIDGEFQMRKKGFENISFTETTDAYLSEHFRIEGRALQTTPIAARFAWEQEYSYQLAVLLHYILATPETPRLSPRFDTEILKDHHRTAFDFSDPLFDSLEGQALKQIIELLGAHDVNQRIHHSELPGLMQCIKIPDVFNEKIAELKETYTNNREAFINRMEAFATSLPKLVEAEKTFQAIQETSPRRRSSILKSRTRLSRSSSKSPSEQKATSLRNQKVTTSLQRMTSSPDTMFHTPTPTLHDTRTNSPRHQTAAKQGNSLSPRGLHHK